MQLSTWKNLDRLSRIFKLEDLAYIWQENSKSINITSTLHEDLCMSTLVTTVTIVALLPGLPMHILLLFLTLLHNCYGHKCYLFPGYHGYKCSYVYLCYHQNKGFQCSMVAMVMQTHHKHFTLSSFPTCTLH